MFIGILIFIVFLVAAFLMGKEYMPSAIALPFMAVLMAAVSGAGLDLIMNRVINDGALMLHGSIIIVIFSVWLGRLLVNTGIAENIIRKAAEYAGDRPILIALLVTLASAFILTSIRGLGAFILVGTIALPILLSVGIPKLMAAIFLLLGYTVGNLMNVGTWGIMEGYFGVPVVEIAPFVFTVTGLFAVMTAGYIVFYLKKEGMAKKWAVEAKAKDKEGDSKKLEYKKVPLISFLTPAVPLIFVMGFDWNIIPAIVVAMVFGLLTTQVGRSIKETFNVTQSAMFDGFKDAAPAITLMIGIGMLLNSVRLDMVASNIQPVMEFIVPTSTFGYIIFFTLAMPLVLYRGPFNMWGMGAGLVTVIMMTGYFPAYAVMAVFMTGIGVQQACEPTNTHNVWAASYTDVSVTAILQKTLLWLWGTAIIGVIISAIMFL